MNANSSGDRFRRLEEDLRQLRQWIEGQTEARRQSIHDLREQLGAYSLAQQLMQARLGELETVVGDVARMVDAMEDASELAKGVADELERRREQARRAWTRRDKIFGAAVALVTAVAIVVQLAGRLFG